MSDQTLTARHGPTDRTIRTTDGKVVPVPDGWELLPPGDPGVTRRVKAAGPSWTVQEQRGRKVFSRGVWAPAATITAVRAELAVERADPAYARKREGAAKRREKAQSEYVEDFTAAVRNYLGFAARYAELADRLAVAVAAHATPVGSGTVARTKRSPVEQRAEAAVIAWLRHQTTAYDDMAVARVKGARREVRRKLAAGSKALLERYRRGEPVPPTGCVLERGLAKAARAG
jgi:hypothetical protein